MTKKLLIVFASGLLLSVVLLCSAWVLGGSAMIQRIGEHGGLTVNFDDDDDSGRSHANREFTFDPSKPFTVKAPVSLIFTRGEKITMRVFGQDTAVHAVRWENGTLSLSEGTHIGGRGLKVEITAPSLPALELDSPAKVKLRDLDQPSLAVVANGAVDLWASGKVATMQIETRGAGKLDLEEVAAIDAAITTKGVGNVVLSASGKVDVRVDGAGRVKLKQRPAQLSSQINGVGDVSHDY